MVGVLQKNGNPESGVAGRNARRVTESAGCQVQTRRSFREKVREDTGGRMGQVADRGHGVVVLGGRQVNHLAPET